MRQLCGRCGETKDADQFQRSYGQGKRRGGRQSYCRACVAAYHREWARKNPERIKANHAKFRQKYKAKARAHRIFTEYGITEEWYQQQVEAQRGACAICGIVPKKLDIDHNHATGIVRGLLCRQCNHAIGLFKDDVVRLDAAIAYLSRQLKATA